MNACILAAGQGTRLNLGLKPKTLVELEGRPLIHYILDSLVVYEFKKIIIVGGYGIDCLRDCVQKHSLATFLVENKDFTQGSLLTIAAALKHLPDDDFILMNADHLYSSAIQNKIAEFISQEKPTKITLICDRDRELCNDDMKVALNDEGQLLQMAKDLTDYQLGYVGMSFIPSSRISIYAQAVNELIQEKKVQLNVESILNHLSQKKEAIKCFDISGSHWIEIDTPHDLLLAREKLPLVL